MHYIIFGAGEAGIHAWEFLQNDRVKCFADNYKAGQVLHTNMQEDVQNFYLNQISMKHVHNNVLLDEINFEGL